MFAYCQNKPTMYDDAAGCAIKPNTTYINDGAGGTPGPIGIFSNSDYQNMQEFYDYDDEVISFSVIEEVHEISGGTKTASMLSGSVDLFSIGSDGFTLLAFDMSVIKLDLTRGPWTFSFFNIGNVSASAGIGMVPYAEVMLSEWSPSISYQRGNQTVTLTLHLGAIGVGYHANNEGVGGTFANGIGVSFSIS